MYTAQLDFIQLRLGQLSGDLDAATREKLIETIGQELRNADNFGEPPKPSTLLASDAAATDIWERHRLELKVLKAQLEEAKRENGS